MLAVAFIAILVIGIASLCAGVVLIVLDRHNRPSIATDSETTPATEKISAAQDLATPSDVPNGPEPVADKSPAADRSGDWRATTAAIVVGIAGSLLIAWAGAPVWLALILGAAAALGAQAPLEQIEGSLAKSRLAEVSSAAIDDVLRDLQNGRSPAEVVVRLSAAPLRSSDFDLVSAGIRLQDDTFGGTPAIYGTIEHVIAGRRLLRSSAATMQKRLVMATIASTAIAIVTGGILAFVVPDFLAPLVLEPLGRMALAMGAAGFVCALIVLFAIAHREIAP